MDGYTYRFLGQVRVLPHLGDLISILIEPSQNCFEKALPVNFVFVVFDHADDGGFLLVKQLHDRSQLVHDVAKL